MSVQPLRRVLTLQTLLAIILPFGIVALIGLLWILPQIRKDSGERLLQLARAVGMQVESHLETGAAIVRASAAMPFDSKLHGHEYQQHLDALLASTDTMSSMYAVSSDGKVFLVALTEDNLIHRNDLDSIDFSRNPLFQKVVQGGKPVWSETFLSVINGGLAVAYAVPGSISSTTVIGEVDLGLLTRFLQQISKEEDILIMIIDHSGQIVADNNGRYTAQQLNISNIPLVSSGITSDAPTIGHFDFAGSSMTGGIIQIPTVDWHVLVARTDASLYRTARNISFVVLAGILIALLCVVMTSMYFSRRLAARFDALTRHAGDIAQGVRSDDWPISNIEEFNRLSVSLQQMARRLQDSETLYRTLFEQLPDGIVLWEVSPLKPLQFNTAAHSLLDYSREEFSLLTVTDFDAAQGLNDLAAVQETLRQEGTVSFETVHRTKSGESRLMFITLRIIELADRPMILAMHRDISERKRLEDERLHLEQQLLHAQKLESLGVLAGGIAHDFNNILMAIMGNADLALMRINKESPAVENLHRIEQSAARAADLAKQMLAYSGKGKFVIENLDINRLLEEMLHMLEVSISKKAVLRFNLHQPLPPVEADATQMRQIIMNLVINASEAIGDKSGVIAVTTGCMDCDHRYLKDVWLDENLIVGTYVYLEISDSGCGMDKETLSKIFDPFFTTKFTGRGLGMAAVLGIVRGHKGAIKVYSELGKGTSFKILLPASGRPVDLSSHDSCEDNWKGSGTVLLVDDEKTVLGIGTEMLEELGFTVITANDGREALKVFASTPEIAFVIMDLTMPHMDGEQCFRELRQLKPDIRVMVSSGYNEQEVTHKFMGKGLAGFIQKPYRLSTLKEAIRNLERTEN
jgi:PAS domain S-box-containing protein